LGGYTFDYLGANTPYWTGAGWLVVAVLFAAVSLVEQVQAGAYQTWLNRVWRQNNSYHDANDDPKTI